MGRKSKPTSELVSELHTVQEEGESVVQYAAKMQEIFLKQKTTVEGTKVGYFTGGLNGDVRPEVERCTFNTLEEAIREAIKVEKVVLQRQKREQEKEAEREKRLKKEYEGMNKNYENILNIISHNRNVPDYSVQQNNMQTAPVPQPQQQMQQQQMQQPPLQQQSVQQQQMQLPQHPTYVQYPQPLHATQVHTVAPTQGYTPNHAVVPSAKPAHTGQRDNCKCAKPYYVIIKTKSKTKDQKELTLIKCENCKKLGGIVNDRSRSRSRSRSKNGDGNRSRDNSRSRSDGKSDRTKRGHSPHPDGQGKVFLVNDDTLSDGDISDSDSA